MALGENVGVALHRGLRADENAKALGGSNREGIGGKALTCFVAVFRRADDVDEVIEVAQREQVGFQILGTVFRLAEEIFRPAHDDFTAMLDVAIDGIFQCEHFRALLMDGQHVDAVRSIHAGELENLIGDHLWAGIALQLDLDARFLIRQVAHAGNTR